MNDKIIDKSEVKHGDVLKISNTKLLLHIHNGANTCINCEPGEVMSKAAGKQETETIMTTVEKEKLRRSRNLEIKKK